MQQGENQQLCSQKAQEDWERLSSEMEREYGPNWQVEKPNLDGSVIYNSTGGMPHGRLAIGNEAISNKDKAAIKSRKRTSTPLPVSNNEIYQQRKISRLERELDSYRGLESVVRVMDAKGGFDFDALAKEHAPQLASSNSDVGFTPEHVADHLHDQRK